MEKGINDHLEKLREDPCYIKSKQNNCKIISSICPNKTILNDKKSNIYWKISSSSSCFHIFQLLEAGFVNNVLHSFSVLSAFVQ